MIVVADASALIAYLLGFDRAAEVRTLVRHEETELHIPSLCDIEVASALRRALLRGEIDSTRADEALAGHLLMTVTRHGHQLLLSRVVELRDNFTAYDATYVALAERLGGAVLTLDARFERAVRTHTELTVLS